jgi:hypothetical protein
MSEANGTAATEPKAITIKDLEVERGYAQAEKDLRLEAEKKLKAFEGIDPEDYKKTKTELEEVRKKKALASPEELEAWKGETEASIRKQVQKDLDEAKAKADKFAQQNKELTVTDRVFAAVAPAVMPDMADFIKSQIRAHGDMNEKGELVFKDANGQPMYAPGSTTQLMNTDQFAQHLRGKFPSSFAAQDKGGVKQPGEKVAAGYTGKVLSRDEIKALPDKGKEYFRQNPAAAQTFLQGK